MDLEEERKAFEAEVKEATQYVARVDLYKWNNENKRYEYVAESNKRKPLPQLLFEVWLAAKQHLLNSQKPKCEVFETMGGSFRVTQHNTRNTLFLTSESMGAALKWAEQNGYQRVICD